MTPDLPPDGSQPAHPRRRWWSLSVRGLMLLVLVVGGAIGWQANRVGRLRRAIATLEREVAAEPEPKPDARIARRPRQPIRLPGDRFAPGSKVGIRFTDQYSNGRYQFKTRRQWLPEWARRVLGEDYSRQVSTLTFERRPTPADWDAIAALGSVEEVVLTAAGTNDTDMVGIDRCTYLHTITCRGYPFGPVTGKTLRTLAALPHLRGLELRGTQIRADDLVALERLDQLETLGLPPTAGTDAGLAHLRTLRNLRKLSAGSVSDVGLASLVALTRLESLDFAPQRLTDVGMATLARFPKLTTLRLGNPLSGLRPDSNGTEDWTVRLTPAGLATLGTMTQLEMLTLDDPTVVDDTWVAAIQPLTRLRILTLHGDRITDDGLAPVRPLVNLTLLDLNSPLVTNAGLTHLTTLTQLSLLMTTSQADSTGAAQLRTALPRLKSILTHKHPGVFRLAPRPRPSRRSPSRVPPSQPSPGGQLGPSSSTPGPNP